MKRSDSISELAGALSKAQAALPAVPKRGQGQVGQAKTTYATLDDVIDTVREPLSENGLSFTQMLDADGGGPALTTMLLHESGQWIASSTPIDAMDGNRGTNAMQAFGSTLTYLKRYALSAMLGVTTDEDDDGSSARKRQQQKPQSALPAKPSAKTPVMRDNTPNGEYPTGSWVDFRDYAVQNLEHYTSGEHVVNALRQAVGGGDYEPWKGWTPERAHESWVMLTGRLGDEPAEDAQDNIPF